jgi:hypothetical protein
MYSDETLDPNEAFLDIPGSGDGGAAEETEGSEGKPDAPIE